MGHLEAHGLFKIPSVASMSAFLTKSSGVGCPFVGVWKGVKYSFILESDI